MKVILLDEVKKVGKKGDIAEVSEGYARNFLLPKNLAAVATEGNVHQAKQNQATEAHKAQQALDEARVLASQIGKVTVTMSLRVGENGKLFGSVTAKDVAEALIKQTGLKIDRRKVELKEAVKALGNYRAVVKLHSEVSAEFTVAVKEQQ